MVGYFLLKIGIPCFPFLIDLCGKTKAKYMGSFIFQE